MAAGRGDRLGAEKPKPFIELGGRTLLQRSVAAFDQHPAIAHLVVVLAPGLVADGPSLAGPVTRPSRDKEMFAITVRGVRVFF